MFSVEMQYALFILSQIKAKNGLEPVKLEELAAEHELSLEFLYKVARKLRIDKFIRAIKGPGGGYVASANFNEISFYELYMTIHPRSVRLEHSTKSKTSKKLIEDVYSKLFQNLVALKLKDSL